MESLKPAEIFPAPSRLSRIRKGILPVIALLTALAVGTSLFCLNAGYTIIFQNLFYLPIILACAFYPARGVLFTTLISATYLIMMLFIPDDRSLWLPAMVRIGFFELVGGVIVYLSKERIGAESELERQRTTIERIVAERTSQLSDRLEESLRQERAYRETVEYYQRGMNQIQTPIALWNHEYYITTVNPAFERLLGRPKSDLIGRKLTTIPQLNEAARCVPTEPVILTLNEAIDSSQRMLWTFSSISAEEGRPSVATIAVGQKLPVGEQIHE